MTSSVQRTGRVNICVCVTRADGAAQAREDRRGLGHATQTDPEARLLVRLNSNKRPRRRANVGHRPPPLPVEPPAAAAGTAVAPSRRGLRGGGGCGGGRCVLRGAQGGGGGTRFIVLVCGGSGATFFVGPVSLEEEPGRARDERRPTEREREREGRGRPRLFLREPLPNHPREVARSMPVVVARPPPLRARVNGSGARARARPTRSLLLFALMMFCARVGFVR